MDLQRRVALVTGVSKGIGLELAKLLLRKGMKVAGWSRTAPKLEHEHFQFFPVDMANEDEVEKAYQATVEQFGEAIDVLVNNAGYGSFNYLEKFDSAAWEKMFAVNVHGIYYVTKRVLPSMKAREYGHIVNLSSIAGKNGIAQGTAYCGTKHAVRGISESLYREVKDFNIKVTCIFPGSVDTHFFDDVAGTEANQTMLHADDVAQLIIHQLEMPDNFNTSEVEIRPMRVKYKKD